MDLKISRFHNMMDQNILRFHNNDESKNSNNPYVIMNLHAPKPHNITIYQMVPKSHNSPSNNLTSQQQGNTCNKQLILKF